MRISSRSVPAVVLAVSALLVGACSGSEGPSATSSVPDRPALVACTDAPYEPFEFGDEELTGFDIDLVDAVADRLGRSATVVTVPLDGFEAALDQDRCDLVASALPIPAAGSSPLLFSDSYLAIDQALVVLADDPDAPADFSATTDRQVGVVADSPSADFAASALPPGTGIIGFATPTEAVDALLAGTGDAVIADAPVAGHLALADSSLTIAATAPTDVRYGIAVGADDPELLAEIDGALAAMEADGTLGALRSTWFGD